jgi:hypothetical protein
MVEYFIPSLKKRILQTRNCICFLFHENTYLDTYTTKYKCGNCNFYFARFLKLKLLPNNWEVKNKA